jgi:phosphoribosylamine--glycine ligase
VILPRLAAPLGPLLLAAARGALGGSTWTSVPAIPGSAVGIVLAAAGYPSSPRRGDAIAGLDEAAASGALVFHAGTLLADAGMWTTDGGRVLTVVGRGTDLADARARAEEAADAITWPGMQRRGDIAASAPEAAAVGASA